jgi:hypothetical protein
MLLGFGAERTFSAPGLMVSFARSLREEGRKLFILNILIEGNSREKGEKIKND